MRKQTLKVRAVKFLFIPLIILSMFLIEGILGDTAGRLQELLIKRKKLYVEFTTITKPAVKPSLKTTWKAYYDFSKYPPSFKLEVIQECYNDPNCERFRKIYENKRVLDFDNWVFKQCSLADPNNCMNYDEQLARQNAEMFGMIYESGKFIDIGGNGPLAYKSLLDTFEYVGDDTYMGLKVKMYKHKTMNGKLYRYKDAFIVGHDGPATMFVRTPLKGGLVDILQGSIIIRLGNN